MSANIRKGIKQSQDKGVPDPDNKRKQALDELAKISEQLKDLSRFPEENPNPVMRVNSSGAIIYANAACSKLDFAVCQIGQFLPNQYSSIVTEVLDTGFHRELEAEGNDRVFSLAFIPILDRGYVNIYGSDITERKHAEKMLLENQKDLNRAQAVAHTGSWRMNIRSNELIWSDENYDIFGIPRGTPLTYESFLSCIHPDDRKYVNKKWEEALQGEEYDIEHRIIVANEVKWVNEKVELEFDQEGMLMGGFGTTQDITTHKQMEQQMEFGNNILTQINDIVIAMDDKETITYFNEAAETAYQVNREEALGRKLEDIFTYRWLRPGDKQKAHNSLDSYGSWIGEIIHIKRNGEEIVARTSISTIKDNTGNVTGRLSVIRDITEFKQASERITYQAELLDAIEDCVIAINMEDLIVYWGKGTENLLHWKQEEVIGQNIIDMLFTEDNMQKGKDILELTTNGPGWEGEVYVKNREGNTVPLLARTSPVFNPYGGQIGAIVVGKDIAELKKVDKMKDEFLSLVSHELRTPLTVITGSMHSIAYPGISPEERNDLIQNTIDSADLLSHILDNMLELSRYQVNHLQLHSEPVFISDVAQNVIGKLQRREASQRFFVHFPADLQPVKADPLRVQRILYNLMDNALKYSPAESKIEVTCRREGDFVITEIADEGVGISSDKQRSIFELFERAQADTRNIQGFGIGLVVCQRLVEAQGGWINIESEAGQGSTFSFALPLFNTNV